MLVSIFFLVSITTSKIIDVSVSGPSIVQYGESIELVCKWPDTHQISDFEWEWEDTRIFDYHHVDQKLVNVIDTTQTSFNTRAFSNLNGSNSTLRIENVNFEDSGSFECNLAAYANCGEKNCSIRSKKNYHKLSVFSTPEIVFTPENDMTFDTRLFHNQPDTKYSHVISKDSAKK